MCNIYLRLQSFRRLLYVSNELHLPKICLSTGSVFLQEKKNTDSISNPSVDMLKKKLSANYRPNKFEKYLLVWMKKYPSVAEVPRFVTDDQMEYVRNWARIKINIALCILTAIGCFVMLYISKHEAKQGASLHKINIDFHKAMDEKARAEEKARNQ